MPPVDVLVVGFGIAGLRAGEAARRCQASTLVAGSGGMASPGVIGFNAPVAPEDSPELFLSDILRNSGGVGSRALMECLANGAAPCVRELEINGVRFDRNSNGGFNLLRPLGCACPRLVHRGNVTAKCFLRKMRRSVPAPLNFYVLDLLTRDGGVCGAIGMLNDTLAVVPARAVVLATGGGGGIYGRTTYPESCCGGGYALALRAGARLRDMEFVQFEPFRCVNLPLGLSTTLLEKGGELVNGDGESILDRDAGSFSKAELALIVARGIAADRGGVFLDLTRLPHEVITRDHAAYDLKFRRFGIDLTREKVGIAPVAHTFLGGVAIDADCASSVPGLFVAGEAAGGVHGANRIGGNAGTEIFVFGAIAGEAAAKYAKRAPFPEPETLPEFAVAGKGGNTADFADGMWNLRKLMDENFGVIRIGGRMAKALTQLEEMAVAANSAGCAVLSGLPALYQWRNATAAALAVGRAAIGRKHSLGVHCRASETGVLQ